MNPAKNQSLLAFRIFAEDSLLDVLLDVLLHSFPPWGRQSLVRSGAGEGNRTLVCSLGSCRSAIELRPRRALISRDRAIRKAASQSRLVKKDQATVRDETPAGVAILLCEDQPPPNLDGSL